MNPKKNKDYPKLDGVSKDMLLEDIADKWANKLDQKGYYDFDQFYDTVLSNLEEQMKMGIEVEQEHTKDKDLAERISLDHLFEFHDYYTRLKEIEKKKSSLDKKSDIFDEYRAYLRELYVEKYGEPNVEIELCEDGKVYEHGVGGISCVQVGKSLDEWENKKESSVNDPLKNKNDYASKEVLDKASIENESRSEESLWCSTCHKHVDEVVKDGFGNTACVECGSKLLNKKEFSKEIPDSIDDLKEGCKVPLINGNYGLYKKNAKWTFGPGGYMVHPITPEQERSFEMLELKDVDWEKSEIDKSDLENYDDEELVEFKIVLKDGRNAWIETDIAHSELAIWDLDMGEYVPIAMIDWDKINKDPDSIHIESSYSKKKETLEGFLSKLFTYLDMSIPFKWTKEETMAGLKKGFSLQDNEVIRYYVSWMDAKDKGSTMNDRIEYAMSRFPESTKEFIEEKLNASIKKFDDLNQKEMDMTMDKTSKSDAESGFPLKNKSDYASKYKSDEQIEKEFEGYRIINIKFNPSNKSGAIELEFPEAGESVGGGSSSVVDDFIIYDGGKIAFTNWYPEKVYLELADYINKNRTVVKSSKDVSDAESRMVVDMVKQSKLFSYPDLDRKPTWKLETSKNGKKKIVRLNTMDPSILDVVERDGNRFAADDEAFMQVASDECITVKINKVLENSSYIVETPSGINKTIDERFLFKGVDNG